MQELRLNLNFTQKRKEKVLYEIGIVQDTWRYRPDLNWGMKVLQTTYSMLKKAKFPRLLLHPSILLLTYC